MFKVTESTTPAEFFEKLIPKLAASRAAALSAEQKAVDHVLAVVLTGAGGGSWSIHAAAGKVTVSSGIETGANPVVESTVEAWRDVLSGRRSLPGVGIPDLEDLDPALLRPSILKQLPSVRGTLRLKVTDELDGDLQVTLRFGPNPPVEPQTTITTDMDTAQELATQPLNPQMALMSGKIKVIGDMGLALQLAALVMAQ